MGDSQAPLCALRDWIVSGTAPQPMGAAETAALLDEARVQGLSGVLAHDPALSQGWPDAQRDQLRHTQRTLLARGLLQRQLGADLLGALGRRGVRALPLKGLALAAMPDVYSVESHRPMEDLDILSLGHWNTAVQALLTAGLELEEKADHAWRFREPSSRAAVELHHSVTSCPGLYPSQPEALWTRSHPSDVLPRLPSPEDLLLQLALHASFQHALRLSLIQWLDFKRLLDARRIDLDRMRHAALEAQAVGPLRAALCAATAVVGADPPEELMAWARSRTPRRTERWIQAEGANPLALVAVPNSPLPARWELSRGRRLRFVWGTLDPLRPGDTRTPLVRGLGVVVRTLQLLKRWAFAPRQGGRRLHGHT
jgi:hypothetical protein